MSKTEAITNQYKQAVQRLQEALQAPKTDMARDSAIKRFEFCFDLAWKLLKTLLEEKKGVICASPKDCFREAYKNGLIEYDDFWLQMTDWRNEAVHTYSEQFAEVFYQKLPKALEKFITLKDQF